MEYSILNDLLVKTTSILFKPNELNYKQLYTFAIFNEVIVQKVLPKVVEKEKGNVKENVKEKEKEKITERDSSKTVATDVTAEKDVTVKYWLEKEAKIKIEQSLNKLGITAAMCKGDHLAKASAPELNAIKKQVKAELKAYDVSFNTAFKRFPNRDEKEAMKPLYMLYKRLKQFMVYAKVYEAEVKASPDEAIKKRLAEVKKERADLRIVLDNFQRDFVAKNNRKIKYNKDIASVAKEFKTYKELKTIIAELESQIKH